MQNSSDLDSVLTEHLPRRLSMDSPCVVVTCTCGETFERSSWTWQQHVAQVAAL